MSNCSLLCPGDFIRQFHAAELTPWLKTDDTVGDPPKAIQASPVFTVRSAAELEWMLENRSSVCAAGDCHQPGRVDGGGGGGGGLVLLYSWRACAFATHGSSASLHFERAARYFVDRLNSTAVRFARWVPSDVIICLCGLLYYAFRLHAKFIRLYVCFCSRVDVSLVDLPRNLRSERVPSIVYFPAKR